jgi:hypothetical protein
LSFIAHGYIWPHRMAVIHGDRRYTWAATMRPRRLSSALAKRLQEGRHDRAILSNTPEMIDLHSGADDERCSTRSTASRRRGDRVRRTRRAKVADRRRVRADHREGSGLAAIKPLVIDIVDFSGG